MVARAIASGTISFGLVSIPVKLYSTSQTSATISFNLLHAGCGSRLKQQYVCLADNKLVSRDEMVKGYEFAKGQYVQFTDDELKAMEEKSTQSIEITEFVPAAKINWVYFDKAYYLGPDKGGDRAYHLLGKAMEATGRSALAKYAARGKQYLVLVRPMQHLLVMQQLHYADEVRPMDEVPVGKADIKDAELQLAVQLVEQIKSDTFRPEAYTDEVRQRIEEAIQQKVAGQEITAPPTESPKAQIVDLMAALKASLGKDSPDGKAPERHPAKRVERKKEGKPVRAPKKSAK